MSVRRTSLMAPGSGHECAETRWRCQYQCGLRQAIVTQHGLDENWPLQLNACPDCGTAYLLQEVWQPLAEESGPACPRCGSTVLTRNGERTFAVYWYVGDPIKAVRSS